MYVEFEAYLDFGTRHRSCFRGYRESVTTLVAHLNYSQLHRALQLFDHLLLD